MTQWNTLSPTINESPRDNILTVRGKPMPPETIGGVFIRYAVFLGIFAGVGRMGEAIPDRIVGTFISTFGAATFVALAMAMFYEWRHTERKWKLYEDVERAKLPAPRAEAVEIHNHYPTQTGAREIIETYTNRPPEPFIRFLFKSAAPDGRIPSERSIAAMPEWTGTAFREWLETLDKAGTTVKVDERTHAARRVVGTLDDALRHFGYGLPAENRENLTAKL